ncbi:MAG: hypothetical protein ACXW3M_10205, partial [Rhodoplanes sp.]
HKHQFLVEPLLVSRDGVFRLEELDGFHGSEELTPILLREVGISIGPATTSGGHRHLSIVCMRASERAGSMSIIGHYIKNCAKHTRLALDAGLRPTMKNHIRA